MVGIYKITSPTGKVYIGQSHNIRQRKYHYSATTCKSQSKLHRSLLKHSWKAHSFEVIHELPVDISEDIITTYEQLYMDLYEACGVELMNLKKAGNDGKYYPESKKFRKNKPGTKVGHIHSAEIRKRMSEALKGIKKSEQHKINIVKGREKNHDSWRANLSIAQKKRFSIQSPYNKIDRNSLKGLVEDYINTVLTKKELAIKYSVSENTVYRTVKEAGVPFRKKGWNLSSYKNNPPAIKPLF